MVGVYFSSSWLALDERIGLAQLRVGGCLIMDDVGSSDGGASQAPELGSRGASTPWEPIQLVFRRYFPQKRPHSKPQALPAVKKRVSGTFQFLSSLNASTARYLMSV